MSFAPRICERLLEALCPPSQFRDGILGDLSEEYVRRKSVDGPAAARSWYYRQALASGPHLVVHWACRVTFGAWIGILAFGLVAMAAVPVAILAVQTAAVMSLGVVPDSIGIVHVAWRDAREAYPLMTQLVLGVPWLVALLAGHLIGRRHRDAPLAASVAAAGSASAIAVAAVFGAGLPFVFLFWFNLAAWTLAMAAGGASAALHVQPRRDSRRHDPISARGLDAK